MTAFEHTFIVGWAQVDANGHLRNSAFINMAGRHAHQVPHAMNRADDFQVLASSVKKAP